MRGPRRTLEHWTEGDGPADAWLARWGAKGMVPEYPWPPSPSVVGGREVWPVALVEKAWLDAHPSYSAALGRRVPS